ncbi:UNVERIFIED_CONTAM: hypothetical protein FKN15_014972 [Acipenser sinensis]
MVECGRCGEWFHGQCEDLQPDDLISMEEYMCSICRVTHMGKYLYVPQKTGECLLLLSRAVKEPPRSQRYRIALELMVECGRCGEWFHGQCQDLQPDDLTTISLQEKGWPEPHRGELLAMKKGGQVWRPPPKFFGPEEPAGAWSTVTLQLLGWEKDIPPWPPPETPCFPCSWAGTASRNFRD